MNAGLPPPSVVVDMVGTGDAKAEAVESNTDVTPANKLNAVVDITAGLDGDQCCCC